MNQEELEQETVTVAALRKELEMGNKLIKTM